ncbi:hypothetical protein GW17_00033886 [Ensete ventricosum]|nr:hypothetical protein GW17_00033886 [Ensete ventricosum]
MISQVPTQLGEKHGCSTLGATTALPPFPLRRLSFSLRRTLNPFPLPIPLLDRGRVDRRRPGTIAPPRPFSLIRGSVFFAPPFSTVLGFGIPFFTHDLGGEIILKDGANFIDERHDEDGANDSAMGENEASQVGKNWSDTVDEGKIDQTKELVIHDEDDSVGKMDKAELDVQGVTGGDDGIPRVGMVFNSYGEAVTFYKRYAMRVGFGVTIKKSSFTTYGLCRRLVLVCSKEGKAQTKACYHQSRPSMKTNCEAAFIAKLWGDGLLHVVEAKLEHNHELNPSEAHLYRCYKNMSSGATKDLAVRAAGLPSQYILNRWRKDFKLLYALECSSKDAYGNKHIEQYDSLSKHCLRLVEIGMVSDEKYQLALKLVREVERSLLDENIFQDLHSRLVSSVTRLTGSDENHAASQVGIVDGDKTPSSVWFLALGEFKCQWGMSVVILGNEADE